MDITFRLKKVIKYLVGQEIIENQRDLAKKMNITESYLSQVINQKAPITNEFIYNLQRLKETLSGNWLLYGTGNMFTEDTDKEEVFQDVEPCSEGQLCSECGIKIPFVPDNIVRSPEVHIKDFVNESDKLRFSTLRDLIGDDINYYQRVITTAMAPDFLPGDILLIKFIPAENIISGGIYILDSRTKGCMVRQIDIEDNLYYLHATNPDYKEVVMKREDIYGFGRIVCQLRSNFNISPSNITNQKLIADKSEQINNLINGQTRLIDEHSKLVDEIVRQNQRQDRLIEMQHQLVESFTKTINTFNIKQNGTISVETKN